MNRGFSLCKDLSLIFLIYQAEFKEDIKEDIILFLPRAL